MRYSLCNCDDVALFKLGGTVSQMGDIAQLCEYYCLAIDRWIRVAAELNEPRVLSTSCAIAGRVYIFGGLGTSNAIEWFYALEHVKSVKQWW